MKSNCITSSIDQNSNSLPSTEEAAKASASPIRLDKRSQLRPRCPSTRRNPDASQGPEAKASAQRNIEVAQQTGPRRAQTGDLSTSMEMKMRTRIAQAISLRKILSTSPRTNSYLSSKRSLARRKCIPSTRRKAQVLPHQEQRRAKLGAQLCESKRLQRMPTLRCGRKSSTKLQSSITIK